MNKEININNNINNKEENNRYKDDNNEQEEGIKLNKTGEGNNENNQSNPPTKLKESINQIEEI